MSLATPNGELSENFEPLSTSKFLIRFQDCDPFRHLNNGKYLDYFLNARDNQVTYDYKLPLAEFFAKEKKGWVVQKHEIAYIRPAVFGEEVIVRTATAFFDDQYALVEGRMLDKDQKNLKSVLWMHLAFVDLKNGRRASHTQEIKDFFDSVKLDEFSPKEIDFDMRVKELNNFYRERRKQKNL